MADAPVIYNLDLDEELLNHLADPDAWVVLQGEGFSEELIEDDEITSIFRWQRAHIREHSRPASASVLSDEFDLGFQAPLTAVGDLIDRMRERYIKNAGRVKLREIVEVQKENPLEVAGALKRAGRELAAITEHRGEVFGTGDYVRAMRRYDKKVEAGPGGSYGFKDLDDHFYGLRGLSFLIGYKKTYKSWMMLQALTKNVEEGRCVWLYSLELPAEESHMRMLCMMAGVPWWRWVRNAITIQDRAAMKEASELMDGLGIYRIAKPPHGQRGIHDLVNTARDAGADLVLVDQLQYVENDKGHSLGRINDPGEYWGVLDDARNLSDEGPLYIAHQFGRAAMGAESMPDIALAKGSSAIEEVCTMALGLWANKDMRRSGLVEVGTLIARNAAFFGSWEMEVELNRDCRFEITRKLDDE